jgi:hypothetical protein
MSSGLFSFGTRTTTPGLTSPKDTGLTKARALPGPGPPTRVSERVGVEDVKGRALVWF